MPRVAPTIFETCANPSLIPVGDIGHTALDPTVPYPVQVEAAGIISFTERQSQVLLLGSLGGTKEEVAQLLACDEDEVALARDQLIAKFETPDLASAVHRAISSGYLPIETKRDPSIHLSDRDLTLIDGFRKGYGRAPIGKELGKSRNAVRFYSTALFERIAANGRTHTVRRSHELALEVPERFPIQSS